MEELPASKSYVDRRAFLDFCREACTILSKTWFKQYFLEALLKLGNDKVPLVRIQFCTVAAALNETFSKDDAAEQKLLLQIVQDLRIDLDQDVQQRAVATHARLLEQQKHNVHPEREKTLGERERQKLDHEQFLLH